MGRVAIGQFRPRSDPLEVTMPDALATVTLEPTNGIAKDRIVNTFAMSTPEGALSGFVDGISNCLQSFYNDVQASGSTVASFLSAGLSRAVLATITRVYDITGHLDGSPHGSPVGLKAWQLGAVVGSTGALPEEVAVVLTTRGAAWAAAPVEAADAGDPGAAVDRPRQRRSGRVFIGPLHHGAVAAVANIARPSAGLQSTLLDAAEGLRDDLDALGIDWAVWSRVDAALNSITDVQVDDAFDTQRRRGAAPVGRQTRNVSL
jgi:hypothetical protein